jgi:hypothetical protein
MSGIKREKADIYIVSYATDAEEAAKTLASSRVCIEDSFNEVKKNVFSCDYKDRDYHWLFYVEDFFGDHRVTVIFERLPSEE